MNQSSKGRRRLSPGIQILIDVLIIAMALGLYYGILQLEKRTNKPPVLLPTPTPVVTATPTPTPQVEPTNVIPTETLELTPTVQPTEDVQYAGMFGEKFGHLFAAPGEVIQDETSYKSYNIYFTLERRESYGAVWFFADIYIRDLSCLKTAFSTDDWNNVGRVYADEIARNNNAVLALSGDYAIQNAGGLTIRNGVLFREMTAEMDLAVLYHDGTMVTYSPDEFNMDTITQNGAYQAWCFGPMLLENGQAKEQFNSHLRPKNPRSAIGYFEPGHYCFVMIDGRQDGYSDGMSLIEMSKTFEELGCKEAYNLDGGQSAMIIMYGEIVNQPYNGGRPIGDIIYIAEP